MIDIVVNKRIVMPTFNQKKKKNPSAFLIRFMEINIGYRYIPIYLVSDNFIEIIVLQTVNSFLHKLIIYCICLKISI